MSLFNWVILIESILAVICIVIAAMVYRAGNKERIEHEERKAAERVKQAAIAALQQRQSLDKRVDK